jgi:hypothetical protein
VKTGVNDLVARLVGMDLNLEILELVGLPLKSLRARERTPAFDQKSIVGLVDSI